MRDCVGEGDILGRLCDILRGSGDILGRLYERLQEREGYTWEVVCDIAWERGEDILGRLCEILRGRGGYTWEVV